MSRVLRGARWMLVMGLALVASSCLAVAAGAGAAGAIAWTDRGASARVGGTPDNVFNRTVAVFRDMGVTQTGQSTDDNGAERKVTGTRGDREITVEIDRADGSTSKVEVYARRNAVDWDKELARDIMTRIVNRGGR